MESVHAILLKVFNFSDTQKIVHAFSKEKGYMSFITSGYSLKRQKSILNVMQVAEVEYFENNRHEFQKLKEIAPVFNLSGIYSNIYKMNIVLLWGEVLNLLLKKEISNVVLYDFISRSVEYLNTTHSDVANFNLFFLYRLTSHIGFRINADSYRPGYVFDINEGSFVPAGGNSYISGPNTAQIIYKLCILPVEEIRQIPLNRESRQVLLDIILLFFSIHLHVDFNIKSIQVIREVFG